MESANKKLDQTQSDAVLDDVSCMVGRPKSSLRGGVAGKLTFSDSGHIVDCTKTGIGGYGIPPDIDEVGDMSSEALFILLVEKDSAFMRLVADQFYDKSSCIIVTAKGQRNVATRLFLWKMKMELELPVYALVDCDPCGLKILSFYGCVYDSANLTTLDIKWLGIRPSDSKKYDIPEECRLPMTKKNIKACKAMLEEDFLKNNPDWVEEVRLMVKSKQKVEIEALCAFGLMYLSKHYLPSKLEDRDWL